MSPTWIIDYLMKEWGVIKQAPLSFAAILLLSFVLTYLFNRWWFSDIVKRKDDLIADRDKKLTHVPPLPERSDSLRLPERAQFQELLARAQKETQDAVASLAGKKQHFKEVERERDRFKNELATTQERARSLQDVQTERDRLQSQINELTHFKIFPEIDLEQHLSTTGHNVQSGVFLQYDGLVRDRPIETLLLTTDLRIRFDNQDTVPSRVKAASIFLRRETAQGEIQQTEIAFTVHDEIHEYEVGLDDVPFQPGRATPYYRFECAAELEKSWGKLLDRYCFIRVVFDVIRQPRYCIDLNVEWETARKFEAQGAITLRQQGRLVA